MTERVEPLLSLTFEGKGWSGDEDFVRSGEPAEVHLDPEMARLVVEPMRAMLGKRLKDVAGIASVLTAELDFESPALPLRDQIAALVKVFDTCSETAAALREMSPEEFPDDEDDDEPDPDPAPQPTAALSPLSNEPADA